LAARSKRSRIFSTARIIRGHETGARIGLTDYN
jgi:hypothetical protein